MCCVYVRDHMCAINIKMSLRPALSLLLFFFLPLPLSLRLVLSLLLSCAFVPSSVVRACNSGWATQPLLCVCVQLENILFCYAASSFVL